MENLLKENQLSYLKNELNHPRMGKLKISNHIKEELHSKFGKSIRDVAGYFHNFNHQSGTKRCPHLRVLDQKIAAWTHPNSDYLYCKGLNMAIAVDRDNKVMITVLHLNTDYYKPQYY
jgi:macrodomain Ter protein organizer (MatP/YcbG family)